MHVRSIGECPSDQLSFSSDYSALAPSPHTRYSSQNPTSRLRICENGAHGCRISTRLFVLVTLGLQIDIEVLFQVQVHHFTKCKSCRSPCTPLRPSRTMSTCWTLVQTHFYLQVRPKRTPYLTAKCMLLCNIVSLPMD